MSAGNRRGLLLLTKEEAAQLAAGVTQLHVPRSFLILEAIQAGLQNPHATTIPGRRSKAVCFRLPAEITERVKQTAEAHDVSQQSLIRHFLFAYLSELSRKVRTPISPLNQTRSTRGPPRSGAYGGIEIAA